MPYVFIAYSRKYPYLPIAIGDTARELAEQVGVSCGCIYSMVSKYEHGAVKNSIYMKVFVEDEDNDYQPHKENGESRAGYDDPAVRQGAALAGL